jgi:hypothetical protein
MPRPRLISLDEGCRIRPAMLVIGDQVIDNLVVTNSRAVRRE